MGIYEETPEKMWKYLFSIFQIDLKDFKKKIRDV